MCNSDKRYKYVTAYLSGFLEIGNVLKVGKNEINLSTLKTSVQILTDSCFRNTPELRAYQMECNLLRIQGPDLLVPEQRC